MKKKTTTMVINMTWKEEIRKQKQDYKKLPEGMYVVGDFLALKELRSAGGFDAYGMFEDVSFVNELQEISEAMLNLNITPSFAPLGDERYSQDENDGLYNWDEKFGLAVKVKMADMEVINYFAIRTEGAWTEEGDEPRIYVPRVLQDADTFILTVLKSLNIGSGPTKDPLSSIAAEKEDDYREWWYSLPRSEREDPDSRFPPPFFD